MTGEGPIRQDIEEHMATHLPCRSWCPRCIAGKAVSDPRRKKGEGPGSVPTVSIDYAFMVSGQDQEYEGDQHPLLVMEDDATKAISTHTMPRKGPDDYAVSRLAQDIKRRGHRIIRCKSDQEAAILALNRN